MQYIDNQELREQLKAFNIDPEQIKHVHLKLQSGDISPTSFIYPKEILRAPKENEYDHYENLDKEDLRKIGQEAIDNGELCVFWLNGGAATRYFNMKKVSDEEKEKYKEELEALTPEIINSPKGVTKTVNDLSYLELKLKNLIKVNPNLKVILMNSFVTDEKTEEHLDEIINRNPELDRGQFFKVLQKPLYPRFTKPETIDEIDVFISPEGELSFAPCGHGDFLHLIQDFFKEHKWPEVKYMLFANIDNFGTTIDPVILGYHIKQGRGRTVELARKNPGDKGGAPCFVNDRLVIVEDMKFPEDFNQDDIKSFNTNTFWFTIEELMKYEEELPLILATKTVEGEEVYQVEHFANDVNLETSFLETPREKRFLPTKRYVDLLIYKEDDKFKKLLQDEYNVV